MSNLIKIESRNIALTGKIETTKNFIRKSKSQNTRRAYSADFRDFESWCKAHGLDALPSSPETIAIYLADLAERGRKASTIQRRLSAIKTFHESKGYESPTESEIVKAALAGIQRQCGQPQNQKKPALIETIKRMVDVQPDTVAGLRNKAIILLGFAGAFRRSELVALDAKDIEFNKAGIIVTIRRSKTDQKGKGLKKAIPYGTNLFTCPVRTLHDWLSWSKSTAIFVSIRKGSKLTCKRLSCRAVADIVKHAALLAGLNPANFSGHSLRSGFATQAAISGARFDKIMDQGGWKNETTVKRYIRDGNLFRNNASERLGL